jgi:predicted transcriptional regulator
VLIVKNWKQDIGIVAMILVVIMACGLSFAQIEILPPGLTNIYTGNSIDFGSVQVGTTKTATYLFKILETSATSATVAITRPSAPFGSNAPLASVTLAPGQSITLKVTFSPSAAGSYSDSFTITARGGYPVQVKTQDVTLTGKGIRASADTTTPTRTFELPSESEPPPITADVTQLVIKLDSVGAVLDELRQKVDNLAGILGEWIVGRGERFYIEPGMSLYNPPAPDEGIRPEIEAVEEKLDSLLRQLGESALEGQPLPAVEVTASSGDRFRDFLLLADQLITATQTDLKRLAPQDPYTVEIVDSFSNYLEGIRPEITELSSLSCTLPLEAQAWLDHVTVKGAPEIVYTHSHGSTDAPKFDLQQKAQGNETVQMVLEKAGEVVETLFPVVGKIFNLIAKDVAKLFNSNDAMINLLSGMSLAQLEIELKLEGLHRGLLGTQLDMSEGIKAEQEALEKIESYNLPQRIEELERKLEELGQTLKQKLDNLATGVGSTLRGEPYWIEPEQERISDTIDWRRSGVINQIELLRKKLDNLARILGEALYGQGFDIEPQAIVTSPVGEPEYDPIKPEIRQLEAEVKIIKEKLEEILRRLVPGGAPGGGFPPIVERPDVPWFPKDGQTVEYYEYIVQQLAVTKKIYVYKEGAFVASDEQDVEDVHVSTDAFDLSGWIDLTDIRQGDEVTVTLLVSVADGPFRTWSTTVFQGLQTRGLKHFTEFADKLEQVVGTDVKIRIAQTKSGDAYATPIPIYYQFVVESQN